MLTKKKKQNIDSVTMKFICPCVIQDFYVNLQFEKIEITLKIQHNGRRKRPQSDARRD